MTAGNDRYGPVVAEAATGHPALVDIETGNLKALIDNTLQLMGSVAASYRAGLLQLLSDEQAVPTGPTDWPALADAALKAKKHSGVCDALDLAKDLKTADRHRITIPALFADVYFDRERTPGLPADPIVAFCCNVSNSRWKAMIGRLEPDVCDLFRDVINRWPVRLLRDADLIDSDEIRLMTSFETTRLTAPVIKSVIGDNRRDEETCALAMLTVLEADRRLKLRRMSARDAAAECIAAMDGIKPRWDKAVPRIAYQLSLAKRGMDNVLFTTCWERWGRRIDWGDMARLAQPVFQKRKKRNPFAISQDDKGKGGGGKHLARCTLWLKKPTPGVKRVAEIPALQAAIDDYVVLIASDRLDPDEIRQLLHEDLLLPAG